MKPRFKENENSDKTSKKKFLYLHFKEKKGVYRSSLFRGVANQYVKIGDSS